jgi:hypothetical protein
MAGGPLTGHSGPTVGAAGNRLYPPGNGDGGSASNREPGIRKAVASERPRACPPATGPRGAAHHPLSVVACQLPLRSWSIAQLATLLVPDAVEDAMVTPSTFSWQVTVPPPFSWALIE